MKNYECDICGKVINNAGAFTRHYNSHTKEEKDSIKDLDDMSKAIDEINTTIDLEDELLSDKNLVIMECGHMGNGKRCIHNCPNSKQPYFKEDRI